MFKINDKHIEQTPHKWREAVEIRKTWTACRTDTPNNYSHSVEDSKSAVPSTKESSFYCLTHKEIPLKYGFPSFKRQTNFVIFQSQLETYVHQWHRQMLISVLFIKSSNGANVHQRVNGNAEELVNKKQSLIWCPGKL